jgi:hypothetical protein
MIARANCSVASGQAKELIRFTPADASVLGIRSVSAAGEIACAYSRKNQKNKESPTCKPMLGHRDQTRELGAPLSPIVASTPSVGAIGATVSRSSKSKSFTNLVAYGTDVKMGDMNLTISHGIPRFFSWNRCGRLFDERLVSAALSGELRAPASLIRHRASRRRQGAAKSGLSNFEH